MIDYKLILPESYVPPALPGRDEWIQDLRTTTAKQGRKLLCSRNLEYCCLGRLSLIQGRLKSNSFSTKGGSFNCWTDGENTGMTAVLDGGNPVSSDLGSTGYFPDGVKISIGIETVDCLAHCNDDGLTFEQIADIIEKVWSNAPKNWS